MARTVLLLGRTAFVLDEVETALADLDVRVRVGTTLDDVERVMADEDVQVVIMGAGLDIETRLAIVRHVITASTSTSVHMKDRDSGREGMLPFVRQILGG